jgi:hypothetical protein
MAFETQAVRVQQCTIIEPTGLHMRTEPNTAATIINTFPVGTHLEFVAVVFGEDIAGNPRWGHAPQGYYFWLGATNRANG